jgi:hypothetical protein
LIFESDLNARMSRVLYKSSEAAITPPTTFKAAMMQSLPAANTGMPAIPLPEHGEALELLLHDMPLPNEAAEPPGHPPELTRVHTDVGKPLESLWGEQIIT